MEKEVFGGLETPGEKYHRDGNSRSMILLRTILAFDFSGPDYVDTLNT